MRGPQGGHYDTEMALLSLHERTRPITEAGCFVRPGTQREKSRPKGRLFVVIYSEQTGVVPKGCAAVEGTRRINDTSYT